MPTGLKVAFSKKADLNFLNILNYIKEDFGSKHPLILKTSY
jgi:hypothetical protein